MRTEQPPGDDQIRTFQAVLDEMFGSGSFPSAVSGDLSDLLATLRHGARLLEAFIDQRNPTTEAIRAKRLLEIEVLLTSDLPMIAADLLPALKKLRELAYSQLGE